MDCSPIAEGDDSAGSDGDDLIVPSAFLVSSRTVKETPGIKTPQKGIQPEEDYGSPALESNFTKEHSKAQSNKKYSLSKLLQEKKTIEQNNLIYNDMQSSTGDEQGLCLLQLSQSQELDISQDLEESLGAELMPELKPRMKKLITSVKNDFPDEFPGECWIKHSDVTKDPELPSKVMENPIFDGLHPVNTYMLADILASRGNLALTMELLSPDLLDWLLSTVAQCKEVSLSLRSMETVLMFMSNQSKQSKDVYWIPSQTMFFSVLNKFGMPLPFKDCSLEKLYAVLQEIPEVQDVPNTIPQAKKQKLHNFLTIYSVALKYFPDAYSMAAVRAFLLASFIFLLDTKLLSLTWTFQELIGHSLASIVNAAWEEEVLLICSLCSTITSHHRNYVHLVDCLPATTRGLQLQHTMALFLIGRILQKEDFIAVDVLKDSINVHQVETISRICSCLSVNDSTDYYQLNSILWLINLALPVTGFNIGQRKLLQAMIMKMRKLNGSIRDPRGAFMNRTKVKDLIVRTITRLNYLHQGLESQCHLEDFFERYSDHSELSEDPLQDITSLSEPLRSDPVTQSDEVRKKIDFDHILSETSIVSEDKR